MGCCVRGGVGALTLAGGWMYYSLATTIPRVVAHCKDASSDVYRGNSIAIYYLLQYTNSTSTILD